MSIRLPKGMLPRQPLSATILSWTAVIRALFLKPTLACTHRWLMPKSYMFSRVLTHFTGRPVRLASNGVINWLLRYPQSQYLPP